MRLQVLLVAFTCTLGIASNTSASLVADYQLDGDAVDDVSSNTAPSTDVTARADRFGTSGGALDFNGTTSIVRPLNIGIDDHTQDFSVSLWFRPNAVAGYQSLFSESTGAASNIDRWHSLGRLEANGTLLFVVGAAQRSGAEIPHQTTGTVNATQWNHAAFLLRCHGRHGDDLDLSERGLRGLIQQDLRPHATRHNGDLARRCAVRRRHRHQLLRRRAGQLPDLRPRAERARDSGPRRNSHGHTNCNTDCDSNGNTHSDADNNSNGDSHSHTDCDAYGHTDCDAYGHTDCDAYGHTDCDAYGHTNRDAYSDANSNTYGYADSDANSNSDGGANADASSAEQ